MLQSNVSKWWGLFLKQKVAFFENPERCEGYCWHSTGPKRDKGVAKDTWTVINAESWKSLSLSLSLIFSLSTLSLSLYFQSFAFSRSPEKARTKFHASASLSSPTSRVPTTYRKSREIIRNKNRITRTAFNVHKDILSAINRKKKQAFYIDFRPFPIYTSTSTQILCVWDRLECTWSFKSFWVFFKN